MSVTIRWRGGPTEGEPREPSSAAEDKIAEAVRKAVERFTRSPEEGPTRSVGAKAASEGAGAPGIGQGKQPKTPVTPAPRGPVRCFCCGQLGHKFLVCIYNPRKNKGMGIDEGTQVSPKPRAGGARSLEGAKARTPFLLALGRRTSDPLRPASAATGPERGASGRLGGDRRARGGARHLAQTTSD